MLAEIGVIFALVLCGFMLWLFLSAVGELRERIAFLEQSYSELYRSLTVIARIVNGGNYGLDNSCGSGGLERGDVSGDTTDEGASVEIGARENRIDSETIEVLEQFRIAGALSPTSGDSLKL